MTLKQTKQPRKARKLAKPRRRAPKLATNMGMDSLTQEYIDTLTNPFDNQGPRLGWGCYVPSSVNSAYFRSAFTSNADGSAVILLKPCAKGLVRLGSSGAAVATDTSGDAADAAAIAASYGGGRVISSGIRCFPSIAATAAPGAIACGALEGMTTTLMNALTANDLFSFPQSRIGIASEGATSTGRPQDTDSFRFANEVVNSTGWATTDELPFSVPYVAFIGLPASTVIYYEAILNFEGLQITQHSSVGLGLGSNTADSLSLKWPSPEQMWAYVRPRIGNGAINTVKMIGAYAARNTIDSYANRALPTSRRMLQAAGASTAKLRFAAMAA